MLEHMPSFFVYSVDLYLLLEFWYAAIVTESFKSAAVVCSSCP